MSSEGDNVKNLSSETNDKSVTDTTDSSQDSQDTKDVKADKVNDEKGDGDAKAKESTSASNDSEKPKNDVGKETKNENEEKVNDVDEKKKEEKEKEKVSKSEKDDTEEGEGSEKEEDEGSEKDEEDDEKKKPLLDQPLEQSGTRERKKVQRFNEDFSKDKDVKDSSKTEIPTGSGTALGEIPRIDASISRFKNDDLRLLHRLLFKAPGKSTLIIKNIKKFNGFDFKKDTEEYNKKISAGQKFEVKQLKSICEMLDLEKKGTKDEIATRIVDFLLEPKDSGKPVGGGRPKRTAAVRANNRGYPSHDDDYSSDEKQATRARRDKGKRPNLKDESSSESDEEFHPSDASDERPRVTKRQRSKRKKQQSEDEASDVEESPSTEDSEEEQRSKRKKGSPRVANNKAAKGKVTPKTRGRKPGSGSKKKTVSPKRGRKPAKDSSEEESEAQEEASSSEDEPLAKKAKSPQPPTDEEIKTYVKEILEGANLEEITMKTVCKQVYAHYPDFDLAHKKDFIKTTVKSLIST